MPQAIIDLDAAMPEDVGVKLDGEIHALPGDIPIPRLLKIERLMAELGGEASEDEEKAGSQGGAFMELYEEVLDLFRIRNPDLEELNAGARQLGILVVSLYTLAADQDEEEAEGTRPPKRGTKSSSRGTRSRGSKS